MTTFAEHRSESRPVRWTALHDPRAIPMWLNVDEALERLVEHGHEYEQARRDLLDGRALNTERASYQLIPAAGLDVTKEER